MVEVSVQGRDGVQLCPYCRLELDADVVPCPACAVGLHADCWRELKACPISGCEGVSPAAPAAEGEPVTLDDVLALGRPAPARERSVELAEPAYRPPSWLEVLLGVSTSYEPAPPSPPMTPAAKVGCWVAALVGLWLAHLVYSDFERSRNWEKYVQEEQTSAPKQPPGRPPKPAAPKDDPTLPNDPLRLAELLAVPLDRGPGYLPGSLGQRARASSQADDALRKGRILTELERIGVPPDAWEALCLLAGVSQDSALPRSIKGRTRRLLERDAPHAAADARALSGALHLASDREGIYPDWNGPRAISLDRWPPELAARFLGEVLTRGVSSGRQAAAKQVQGWLAAEPPPSRDVVALLLPGLEAASQSIDAKVREAAQPALEAARALEAGR